MTHFYSASSRALPIDPNLEQLRKQAKELLHWYRAGEDIAVSEIERFERNADPTNFALSDAQRVLARAYGFSSWAKLKEHVDGVNFAALLAAAEAGDIAMVRRLAEVRPDLINPNHAEFRDSALHRAVLRRDEELTRVLMQLGADARVGIWPHRDATSAYAIAVDREYSEIVATIEREEGNRRARLSHERTSSSGAVDALLQAIAKGRTTEAIALLEADPALCRACDVDGITPLHMAAWRHDPALVGWLLDHGALPGALALCADPVQRDVAKSGKTPFDFAAIVAGWVPVDSESRCYFMENARVDPAQFHETTRLLLQKCAELTPRAAVALGDREAVLRLHREGRLSNEIHLFRGGLLAIAVRVNRLDMLTTLLDLELDPDESVVTDDDARSWGMPLWFASMCGRHEIAEMLLSRGADVNAIVYACGDSLCMAADKEMEALLRKHGARLSVEQVADHKTAQAILDGTIPAYSLNVDEPTPTDLAEQMLSAAVGSDPEIVRMCLPHITRKCDDPWWNYALLNATLPDSVKLLLRHGINPDVTAEGGYTTLHHLATENVDARSRVPLATLLLDAGASLSKRDLLLKSTPLGWACRWGRLDLLQLYLQRGAEVLEPDAPAWAMPLAWATKGGHHEIAQLLRSHGAAT